MPTRPFRIASQIAPASGGHRSSNTWSRADATDGRRHCRPSACRCVCAQRSAGRLKSSSGVNIALYSTASNRCACGSISSRRDVPIGKNGCGATTRPPGSRAFNSARSSKLFTRSVARVKFRQQNVAALNRPLDAGNERDAAVGRVLRGRAEHRAAGREG